MDKYFEIRVYRLNKKDILENNRLERKFDQETWIMAKKVPFGFREIKTGIFIPDKIIFMREKNTAFTHNFFYLYNDVIDELRKKGSIIFTDTKIKGVNTYPVNVKQIKAYLERKQPIFKKITENIKQDKKDYKKNIRQQIREKRIKKYIILKDTIEENIKNCKKSLENNNEIKQLIKKYKKEGE